MPRPFPSPRVLLVAMPWARLEHPSIQLGLLKAILDGRGIPCRQLHLYLDFVEHTAEHDPTLGPDAYDEVATRHLVGDWIFAVPPFVPDAASADSGYLGFLEAAGEDPALLAIAASMRKAVPSFLEWAVEHIVRSQPVVVGFTTTFGQTVASLVTALLVKRRLPGVTIVFGGAHCDGAMGEALFRCFTWIDVVVRGEAEPVFGELVESLLKSETPAPRPGLCFRSVHGERITPMAASVTAPPDTLPFVEYDDYFERLDAHRFAAQLSPHVSIPFESSRGCWWGEKHHCSFCGLNGSSMTFRRFDPGRVFDELLYLARRYQRLNFNAADNILDRRAFDTFIPRLIEASCDFRLFYEVKANLRKSELAQLRAAGVMQIQPGLESLSTSALRRIEKGTTALQNIRLLKWCAAFGIQVHWNIIHGLPGDSSAEYDESARAARSCYHLDAPNMVPLWVERFSPYHDHPRKFGIEILGPKAHYGFTYPVGAPVLHDLAYAFDHRQIDGAEVEPGLTQLRQVVSEWQAAQEDAGKSTLTLLRGPGFVVIQDRRAGRDQVDYRLGEVESRIYEACDDGIGVGTLCERLGSGAPSSDHILTFLTELVDADLVFREGDRFLSLAVEARPPALETRRTPRPDVGRVISLKDLTETVRA
jgi:ribosomal peptide maturation radical SAM protein 1